MIATTIAALASGSLVGFALGLVGGGGSIMATQLLLYAVGVQQPHIAIGTSALAVSVNAFAKLACNAMAGNVRWCGAIVFAAVGTFGELAGSSLGKLVDGERLLFLFGLLMLDVGAAMLRRVKVSATPERPMDLGTIGLTGAVGFAPGFAFGFFGIGGVFLIVPGLMLATGMSMTVSVRYFLFAACCF